MNLEKPYLLRLPKSGFLSCSARYFLLLATCLGSFLTVCTADTLTWTGNGGDSDVSNKKNWNPRKIPAPGDTLIFSGTRAIAPVISGNQDVAALSFSSTADAFTLGGTGSWMIGSGGIVNNSSSLEAISNGIVLSAAQTWNASAGSLLLGGSVDNSGNLLTIDGTFDTILNGVLSGSGGLTKIGSGTIRFDAVNTYNGLTNIKAGRLLWGTSNAFSGAVTIDGAGAVLDLGSGQSGAVGTVIVDHGGSIVGAGSSLTSTAAFDLRSGTVSANLSGVNGLTKSTTGTVIVSGADTFTGATTISAGTLQLGASNALSSTSAVTLAAGATLDLNGFSQSLASLAGSGSITGGSAGGNALTVGSDNTSTTYSGALSGAADLTKKGNGTLTLTGTNLYTGSTNLNAGTVIADSDARLGSGGALRFGGGTLQAAGNITSSRAISVSAGTGIINTNGFTVTLSGSISGSLSLLKSGAGTLKLSGTSSGFTGGMVVSAGTLDLAGSSGSSAVDVQTGAILSGTGTAGAVTVESGGTLAPGESGTGRLTTGSLNLRSGGHFALEIGGVTAGAASGGYDQVKASGSVTLAGDLSLSVLNGMSFSPTPPANYVVGGANVAAQKFFLIDNDSGSAVTGAFSNQITAGNVFGGAIPTIFLSGQNFAVSYTGNFETNSTNGGYDVVLTPVPEPGAWAMLLAGLALHLALTRFRLRKKFPCLILLATQKLQP